MRPTVFACALTLGMFGNHVMPAAAQARCAANLSTGIDVSASITPQELRVQTDGISEAITSPNLLSIIQSGEGGCIGISVYLWSDNGTVTVLPWRVISSLEDARQASAELAANIDAYKQQLGALTNTAQAIQAGAELLLDSDIPATRLVLNILTNGTANAGVQNPAEIAGIRDQLTSQGITINGVALGSDITVTPFLRAAIIGGKGAFVLSAEKSSDLAAVFLAKFRLDLSMVME